MTAAEHKLVIDKGSDFTLLLKVKTNLSGLSYDNLTGYSYTFNIYKPDSDSTDGLTLAHTFTKNVSDFGGRVDPAQGELLVYIDATDTAQMETLNPKDKPFDTLYNYYYTIQLEGPSSSDEYEQTRDKQTILRGRLSVRIG